MTPQRFDALTGRYPTLRIALLGDFCLDRYWEIDPARKELSIETGLPVYNVVRLRSQPGGAGTILNNLAALGVGRLLPIGFCGDDGEGFELQRALRQLSGVAVDHFFVTPHRHTFTYNKPLVIRPRRPPQELNRLDVKNWTPTPPEVEERLVNALEAVAGQVDALIVLEQCDTPDTGVVTRRVLKTLARLSRANRPPLILADSRRSLRDFPPVGLKMNRAELRVLTGMKPPLNLARVRRAAQTLAKRNRRPVFVTLSEHGMLGALPDGQTEHLPALPVRGPIDIVGAGDAVMANLAAARTAGAALREALELANAAASVVIHKLGTTGTASVSEIRAVLRL
ncbi:MAG: PfkB family carbohydrate kinase [Verrucomicrobiae bacterium]|nr:PfkB family carbohydrate kinase [Verrucomicrobiae bacterium]